MAASGPGTSASIPGSQPGAWSSSSLFRSVRQSWKMALSTVAPPRACCRADRKRGEIATSSRTFMLRQRFVPRQSSARSDRRIGRRPLARPLPPLAGRSGTLQRTHQEVRRQPASQRAAAPEVGCHESTEPRSCGLDRPTLLPRESPRLSLESSRLGFRAKVSNFNPSSSNERALPSQGHFTLRCEDGHRCSGSPQVG